MRTTDFPRCASFDVLCASVTDEALEVLSLECRL